MTYLPITYMNSKDTLLWRQLLKQMGHEADPSSPFGADKGSHTSAHPTCLHDRDRDNFYPGKGDQNLQQGL